MRPHETLCASDPAGCRAARRRPRNCSRTNAFTAASYKQLAGGDANLILSPFNIAPEREKSSRCGGTRWYLEQHYGLVPDHEFSEAETLPPRSRTGAPR